jgi:insertion element IS1 protein InsB
MNHLSCPHCRSSQIKLNGHTHYRKHNHQCLACGRQFVADSQLVSEQTKELIKRLLLERLSLSGICRAVGVSLRWLLNFIAELYDLLPDDLFVQSPQRTTGHVRVLRLEAEADEMWSFVGRKINKQWIWIALDTESKQVIAFYVGDRSRRSARKLWERIPAVYREQATFYTDAWEAYKEVIAAARHRVCAKRTGHTNIIERFNCTLRQRVSRLVRGALSFSKSLTNHIGAIKYFICHYNQEVAASITFS